MIDRVIYSRKPSKEGVSQVYFADISYTPIDQEMKHDLKIMLSNYNKYNELMIRHYNLKKWATISFIVGLFFIWSFLVLVTRPQ